LESATAEAIAERANGRNASRSRCKDPGGLNQLDREYQTWLAGVRGLGEEGLTRPCGPTENDWADEPVARLILHIHRELIHHGAEVACLRDLYAHADGRRLS
jgi:hypothetical protein